MTKDSTFKILIADDNPDNVYLLQRRLQKQNYTFYTAADGRETLNQVNAVMPDLILLDVNMPKLDGFEVCRRLRQTEALRYIPIIIVTAAKTSLDDQITGLGLGADDYVTKPFNMQELALRVERKLQLKALEDKLRRQQKDMAAILSSSTDAILRIGIDGLIDFFNQAAAQLFALNLDTPNRNTGQHYQDLLGAYPDFTTAFEQIKEKASREAANFEIELSEDRIFSVNIAPITEPDSQLNGWVLSLQDITHFKKMDQLKSTIITNAAHDLKNPLSSALLYLDMLVDNTADQTELSHKLATNALQCIERMKQMTIHLLDLERLETGNLLDIRPCNIVEIVTDLVDQMSSLAQQAELHLTADMPDSPIIVDGDFIYLSRAIANVIHNAIKFTSPNGSVCVTLYEAGDRVILLVRDTGSGILPENQTRIFDRFYRVKREMQSKEVSGSGLGLSIVKSIVEQHKGLIWLESQPEQGTTFTISLPCAATEQASMA